MGLSTLIEHNLAIIIFGLAAIGLALVGWVIFLQIRISKLRQKSEAFFAGGKVHNLEELLVSQAQAIKTLDKDIQELFTISNKIHTLAFKGIFKVGLIRFNPFKDVGGDQSFALALLNGKNNGITISSLYTREGTRVYSKSIVNGESEKHPLTEEEKEAIKMALGTPKKKKEE